MELVANLKKDFPNIRAQIIGDGIERNRLENQIKALGLAKNVQLLGLQPRSLVLGKMQKSKVLLHPSEYESYGYVFAEALQQGMSIVSRKVGFAEASERWSIAERKSEFVFALSQLLNKKEQLEALVLHDVNSVVEQYIDLYESVWSPKKKDV